MKKSLIVLPLVLAITACSSLKYSQDIAIEAPKIGTSPGDEVKYPDWYVASVDDKALYSVATEYSSDMQFAVDKAMLSGKRELASNFSSHINGMLKDYAAEVGDSSDSVIRDIDRTTKMVVSQVNLIGVQRTNFKIVHEKTGYRAFVKLRYATDDSNRVLLTEIKKNAKLKAKLQGSKSFKEMEESIQKIESTN